MLPCYAMLLMALPNPANGQDTRVTGQRPDKTVFLRKTCSNARSAGQSWTTWRPECSQDWDRTCSRQRVSLPMAACSLRGNGDADPVFGGLLESCVVELGMQRLLAGKGGQEKLEGTSPHRLPSPRWCPSPKGWLFTVLLPQGKHAFMQAITISHGFREY